MAERESINNGFRLDIQQLQQEAQRRWLRPAEISEILRNYQTFQISSEPPNQPPGGSLFLFDRRVLRYFRKDGHNWRKKKDGKTINEAHEKLKVGSVDVLHVYYAHGEDNDIFQRRIYWMLDEEYTHIVFVHYLEVKGNRRGIKESEPVISNSLISNSLSNSISSNYNEAIGGNTGSPSASSSYTSSHEDVESENNHQALSKYPAALNSPLAEDNFGYNKTSPLMNSNLLPAYPDEYRGGQLSDLKLDYASLARREIEDHNGQFRTQDLKAWNSILEQSNRSSRNSPSDPLLTSTLPVNTGTCDDYSENFSQILGVGFGINSALAGSLATNNLQKSPSEFASIDSKDNLNCSVTAKQPLLGSVRAEESLQKVDSFSKWMTKELDGVEDLNSKPSSSWQNTETAAVVDDHSAELENFSMSPSIDHDQLFDIHDFSPSFASTDTETKVVITGKFLVSSSELSKYNWSCMFGEVEVPADVTRSGVLCCYAPSHSAGRVPLYVTCSNRFACSQVREFEFLAESQNVNSMDIYGSSLRERQLLVRLGKLLSLRSLDKNSPVFYDINKKSIIDKILLLMEDELCHEVEEHLKEKVVAWLLDKVTEDGKGPSVLDPEGQGLLHLAAALGYDWIIPPTLAAGVNVNFRDVNGWTALHWAASTGRENTVAMLISLGAAPGALTDPSPEFPLGRTPADLGSANGYKGISGFLAESSLTAHLASLTMTDQKLDSSLEDSILKAVQTIQERVATPGDDGDGSDLSLKDSLAAVRNATQAAGRIHQVFRMQSFQRKQIDKCADDEYLLTDECVLTLISSKIKKSGHPDERSHSAAVHIQKKFRGWKQRKEFLIIRERVVKIQAHVRGHQVRKRYKTVVWSVGILEKIILRWRRKGTGLRGFCSDAQNKSSTSDAHCEASSTQVRPSEEEYDFLKEGRKQSEERLQKALVRVKSMAQYPEGRAQYRRLLTAFQKNQQQSCNKILNSSEDVPVIEGEEDMIDVERLLDDDNFMAIAFD